MTPIDYIRFALQNKGISQRELAASLGEKAQVVNQQLNRQNDLKAERFIELMEHLGYQFDYVDNGIRKISHGLEDDILAGKFKGDKFYIEDGDFSYTGYKKVDGEFLTESFWTKEKCLEWLGSE